MFCNKCGAQVPNGSPFCTRCGSKMPVSGNVNVNGMGVNNNTNNGGINWQNSGNSGNISGYETSNYSENTMNSYSSYTPAKKSSKGIIAVIVGILVVAVVVVAALLLFGTKPYEKPIKNYIDGCMEADADKILSAFHDSQFPEDVNREEVAEILSDAFDTEDMEDMEEFDYEIGDAKDLSESKIESLEKNMSSINGADVNIDEAKEVEVTLIHDDDEKEFDIIVVKIDGEWYIGKTE